MLFLYGCSTHSDDLSAASLSPSGSEVKGVAAGEAGVNVPFHYLSRRLGELQNPALTEASGMAASRREADLLWILNDGGNPPLLFATASDGSDRGVVRVDGAKNHDWEDMASFVWGGRPYLLIADIGDNRAKRARCYLYFVPEPKMPGSSVATVARTIEFVYEDGPRDAESLAVDLQGRRILILTKRDLPPVLYELPLFPRSSSVQIARRVTSIAALPQPPLAEIFANPVLGRLGDVPTAMDISPDGTRVAVLTYRAVLLFVRSSGVGWEQSFSEPPVKLAAHQLSQGEALAFGSQGECIYYTSEQRPAPLWCLSPAQGKR